VSGRSLTARRLAPDDTTGSLTSQRGFAGCRPRRSARLRRASTWNLNIRRLHARMVLMPRGPGSRRRRAVCATGPWADGAANAWRGEVVDARSRDDARHRRARSGRARPARPLLPASAAAECSVRAGRAACGRRFRRCRSPGTVWRAAAGSLGADAVGARPTRCVDGRWAGPWSHGNARHAALRDARTRRRRSTARGRASPDVGADTAVHAPADASGDGPSHAPTHRAAGSDANLDAGTHPGADARAHRPADTGAVVEPPSLRAPPDLRLGDAPRRWPRPTPNPIRPLRPDPQRGQRAAAASRNPSGGAVFWGTGRM
jgi:hypothetical protein